LRISSLSMLHGTVVTKHHIANTNLTKRRIFAVVCNYVAYNRLYKLLSTALQSNAARSCDAQSTCPSVRPSLRPSVKRVNCDNMKEIPAHILISHERSMHPVCHTNNGIGGRRPIYLKF